MIFGATVNYDDIYSFPFRGERITAQEMLDTMPRYDSNRGNSTAQPNGNRLYCDVTKTEAELLKQLYSKLNAVIDDYVKAVVDQYEYSGSPVYADEGVTREALGQMVNQVIDNMKNDIDEIEEILLDYESYGDFSQNSMLYSLAQALILAEVFLVRRPRYRQVQDNYVYLREK